MTGARICRAAKYLDPRDEDFMVTYGDGLSDLNLRALLDFHRGHGKLATVTGVHPPSRFGELECDGDKVCAFGEKPHTGQGLINGGFFCFQRRFLDYLNVSPDCVLERGPLDSCAADGEMCVYRHSGYWQCMDTYRDWLSFESQWQSGSALGRSAPWGSQPARKRGAWSCPPPRRLLPARNGALAPEIATPHKRTSGAGCTVVPHRKRKVIGR